MSNQSAVHTVRVRPFCAADVSSEFKQWGQLIQSLHQRDVSELLLRDASPAHAGESSNKLSLALASCAAAMLLQSSSADAKVIFEKPQTKKVKLL